MDVYSFGIIMLEFIFGFGFLFKMNNEKLKKIYSENSYEKHIFHVP
jgi:hypothetical protein